jgi:hypothetical protein
MDGLGKMDFGIKFHNCSILEISHEKHPRIIT